ncbi:MAG: BppU family phage baseplate upper protein [Bacillota bacterium]
MRNEFVFDVDLKRKKLIAEPTVTQHDDLRFIVRIFDNAQAYVIPADTTLRLVGQRKDKKSYFVDGVKSGENEVTFDLAKEQVSVVGKVYVAIQITNSNGRVSSLPFTFEVIKDIATDYKPSPDEKTLIELVIQDGPGIIEEARLVAQENKTRFLTAVDTVATRDSTYTSPKHGDTVRVTSEAKTYRYVTGSGWVVTDAYNPTAVDELNAQLAQTTSDLKSRGINIMKLDFGVKQDGTNTSTALYNALKYCKDNNYSARIPAGTYTIGTNSISGTTSTNCLPIPSGLTVYIEQGAIFKLINDAPAWSRVIVPEDNVKIYGELVIDGSADTITSGNEHMAGLFTYGRENVYIQRISAYNCYGDNVQISGTGDDPSLNIKIDFMKCRKAGRKNLVLEASNNVHIGTAILDNTTGNVSNGWQGGNSLDIEPFSLNGHIMHNRIDHLETIGTGNDFTSGTTESAADNCILDIGTFIQKRGIFLCYSLTLNIDNAYFYEDVAVDSDAIRLMYGSKINIGNAHFDSFGGYVIKAEASSGYRPRVVIDKMTIRNTRSLTPVSPVIYWRGSSIKINHLDLESISKQIINSQMTTSSELYIGTLTAKNCGEAGKTLIYLDSYNSNKGSTHIDALIVRDSRSAELLPSHILEFQDTIAMQNCKISHIHNPNNIPLFKSSLGNFTPALKIAGIDDGCSIFIIDDTPENKLISTVGSIALRRNGTTGATLYVKELGTDSAGWVGK